MRAGLLRGRCARGYGHVGEQGSEVGNSANCSTVLRASAEVGAVEVVTPVNSSCAHVPVGGITGNRKASDSRRDPSG